MQHKDTLEELTGLGVNASSRANAAFVVLARNSDVWAIVESIRGMEGKSSSYRDPTALEPARRAPSALQPARANVSARLTRPSPSQTASTASITTPTSS